MKTSRFHLSWIDPVASKAFWFACETLNFSKAAQEAGMTQSGISKSIAKLEASLEVKLFVRGPRGLTLTKSGQVLKSHLEDMNEKFLMLSTHLKDEKNLVSGVVKYAMPESCLMSPHFSRLLEMRKSCGSEIDLQVTIATNQKIESLVADGKVDFGFMTCEPENLISKPYCLEEYILIGNQPNRRIESEHEFSDLRIIQNPDWTIYFNKWKQLSNSLRNLKSISLNSACSISDLRGAVTFVANGLPNEVTFIPRHCVLHELEKGLVHEITRAGKPALNQIYNTYATRKLSDRVKYITDQFYQML
ncbi:MAG: LysR family transcriptional regulator [Bdellovibrionaceae bacterium]|nr:LysR family transcriptional regulator [Pseudobdellovibrionaceae bacterium]